MPPKPSLRILIKSSSVSKRLKFRPAVWPGKSASLNPAQPRLSQKPRITTTRGNSEQASLHSVARYLAYGSNIVLAWCTITWVRDHYLRVDAIRGSSMAPTINPATNETGQRDWIIFKPYLERSPRKSTGLADAEQIPVDSLGIQRGDIVTFWKPHKPEEISIKRVVAIEGDTVYPQRGYALEQHFNGKEILQGMPDGLPDNDHGCVLDRKAEIGKIVIPFGYVWVEGDNARKSLDSNDFGPISKGLIREKAIWVWRDWLTFFRIFDARSKQEMAMASRVIRGRSTVPPMFLD